MRTTFVIAVLALVLVPSAATPQEVAPVSVAAVGAVRIASDETPAPFGLPTRMLPLDAKAPAGLEPTGLIDPLHTGLTLHGQRIAIVLGRSSAEESNPNVIAVDADANGRLDASERHEFEPWSRAVREKQQFGGSVRGVTVKVAAHTFLLDVGYRRLEGEKPQLGVLGRWFFELPFEIEDRPYRLCVRDGDLDGSFDAKEDHWCILGPKPPTRPLHPLRLSGGEGVFLDGRRFLVVDAVVGPKDIAAQVIYRPAKGPEPGDLQRARERVSAHWRRAFEPGMREFEEAYLLDIGREVTKHPVAWKYVTFREAITLARRSKRPLFVDVSAFWCAWCYRLDVHTYPDREVAELLRNNFVTVKIIEEQDRGSDFRRLVRELGQSGLPVMGVWNPDGKLVHRINAWRKPQDFVAELRSALEKVEKR